jgi:hypothetical protein
MGRAICSEKVSFLKRSPIFFATKEAYLNTKIRAISKIITAIIYLLRIFLSPWDANFITKIQLTKIERIIKKTKNGSPQA